MEAILSNFDFRIEYIKRENNSILDFLTHGFYRIHGIMALKKATQLSKTTNKQPESQSSKNSQTTSPLKNGLETTSWIGKGRSKASLSFNQLSIWTYSHYF